jgi:hypothetical protein
MQRSEPGRQKKKPKSLEKFDHEISRTQMKLTIGWLVDLSIMHTSKGVAKFKFHIN